MKKKKKPVSGKHKIIGYKTQPQLRVYRMQKTKQKLWHFKDKKPILS